MICGCMKLLNLFTALFNSFCVYVLKSLEHSNRATRQSTDSTHLNIPHFLKSTENSLIESLLEDWKLTILCFFQGSFL